MGKARNLATLAGSIGALAYLNTVPVGSVTGLGALATLNSVGASEITNGSVTATKLGTDEQRRMVRAFGYIDGSTGNLVSGFGLTASRSATGTYTVTLSSAAPNTDYTVVATARHTANLIIDEQSGTARTTTVIPLRGRNTSTASAADVPFFSVAILW